MSITIIPEEKSMEELEREITCGICQEHYTEPKVLPCLHYYCKQCVLRLALRTGTGKAFPCPECHVEIILPEGGVDKLKPAPDVNYTTSYSPMKPARIKDNCENCDSRKGTEAFCIECARFICTECIKTHNRMIITS